MKKKRKSVIKMPSCPECSTSINMFKIDSNGEVKCSHCGAILRGKDYYRNNMIVGLIFFLIITPAISILLWDSIWLWSIDLLAGFIIYWFVMNRTIFEKGK